MKILVDQKGKEAIEALCDIALRSTGVKSIYGIQEILKNVKDIPNEENKQG